MLSTIILAQHYVRYYEREEWYVKIPVFQGVCDLVREKILMHMNMYQ